MPVDLARIRSDFAKAAASNGIDAREAEDLVKRVKQNKLTESEAKTFRAEMKRYANTFDPGAKTVFDAFSAKMRSLTVLDPGPRPNPGGRPDPVVMPADVDRVEQTLVKNGELFINGISGKDPEQLYLGDCYLMAAMSAVAFTHPDIIDGLFEKVKGTSGAKTEYDVTLYRGNGTKKAERIDTDLPKNGWYGYYYARAHNPKELWPALLEKAFAQRAGGYPNIEGGEAGVAMQALTGKKSVDTLTRGQGVSPDEMFEKIQAALKANKPITAATYGDSSRAKYEGNNVFADHTYVVLDAWQEGGKKYIKLRNPWGNTEPAGNGRDDGIFKLELGDLARRDNDGHPKNEPTFMNLFWGISVNG